LDYETEQPYYIPSGNTKDSDRGSYYESSKTYRDSLFNSQSNEDDYSLDSY